MAASWWVGSMTVQYSDSTKGRADHLHRNQGGSSARRERTSRRRIASRVALTLILGALAVTPTACTPAARWSDEAVQAAKRLFGVQADDDARAILNQAAATTNRSGDEVARATVTWAQRVIPIRDRIMARVTGVPEDEERVRSFVVGSVCDALERAASVGAATLPSETIGGIIEENRVQSVLPPIVGYAELVGALKAEIEAALAGGDLRATFEGLTQTFICQLAAG